MPLKGQEQELADAICKQLEDKKDNAEAWRIVIESLVEYITTNATVVGACPSSGGPLTGGKIL